MDETETETCKLQAMNEEFARILLFYSWFNLHKYVSFIVIKRRLSGIFETTNFLIKNKSDFTLITLIETAFFYHNLFLKFNELFVLPVYIIIVILFLPLNLFLNCLIR